MRSRRHEFDVASECHRGPRPGPAQNAPLLERLDAHPDEVVQAGLDDLVRMGVETLELWGISCRPWSRHSMAFAGNIELMPA